MTDFVRLIKPRPRGRKPLFLAAAVLIAGAVGLASQSMDLQQKAATLKSQQTQRQAQMLAARVQLSKDDIEAARKWSVLTQERHYPWAKVFRAVERANDPDIELLEFRPDRQQGTVVLKGEARSAESIARYLELLQADTAFRRVYLTHTAHVEHGRLLTRAFEIHALLTM